MPIPTDVKDLVKDYLWIKDANRDEEIETVYKRALDQLIREFDLTAQEETIDTVVSQSIYSPDAQTHRILDVLYNQGVLRKATSDTLDWVRSTWESESDGTPEYWFTDHIPEGLDSVVGTLLIDFAVVPPPDTAGSGSSGLTVFSIIRPDDDDPVMTYLNPMLMYRTAANMLRESTEEADEDAGDREQITNAVAEFLDTLVQTWGAVLRSRLPS